MKRREEKRRKEKRREEKGREEKKLNKINLFPFTKESVVCVSLSVKITSTK